MKVYMKVEETLCTNKQADCRYCLVADNDNDIDNEYRFECEPTDLCEYFNMRVGRACMNAYRQNKTICKSIKNIEIRKTGEYFYSGDVTIGRSVYRLDDIEILKVDYEDGRGFITEWGGEDLGGK